MTTAGNTFLVHLVWDRTRHPGAESLTYRTSAEIGHDTWSFTIDSPRKGFWIAVGRKNGDQAHRSEHSTLKAAMAAVQAQVDESFTATAGHLLARLTGSVQELGASARSAALSFRSLAAAFGHRRICDCPTPTHRMSCGTGAVPRVVSR